MEESVSNLILDQNDTSTSIETKSIENQCKDIGSEKQWAKKCPDCGKNQTYATKYCLAKAIEDNVLCRKCYSKHRSRTHYRIEKSYVNEKFGKLTITTQYVGKNNDTWVNCLCDCGRTKSCELYRLKNGYIESCGCQRKETNQHTNSCFKRKEYGWSSFMLVYNGYKGNARHGRSGVREFSLSKEDAMKLFKGNCFYCGSQPSKVRKTKKSYGEFIYNGIDRKDNTIGYILDNCVSCCEFCNMTKLDTPFNTFIEWIRNVYKHTTSIKLNE